MIARSVAIALGVFSALWSSSGGAVNADQPAEKTERTSHPLMPGIRSAAMWDANWSRTLHDGLATGFSPLVGRMTSAPRLMCESPPVGSLDSVRALARAEGAPHWLIDDGRLRRLDEAGNVLWTQASLGEIFAVGDLRGDGKSYAVGGAANELILADLQTGRIVWRHSFAPPYVAVQAKIADVLPEMPGQEALVIPHYSEAGALLNLAPEDGPRVVWQRPVVTPGEFDERCDHHGGTMELDFSDPEHPAGWNVRRYRCRGFDLRTGDDLGAVAYDVGGAHRRNYGPMKLARDADGQLYACVFGEDVQVHVHAIRLRREGSNELAWQHYYGEVYKEAPGVTLKAHGVADVNGDGCDEMIYSVRDPAQQYRSFVRGRNVATGAIEFELPDQWGCELFTDVGAGRSSGLVALAARGDAPPQQGRATVLEFRPGGPPTPVGAAEDADLWGPLVVSPEAGGAAALQLRVRDAKGVARIARFDVVDGKLQEISSLESPELADSPLVAQAASPQGGDCFLVRRGSRLRALDARGVEQWATELEGGEARISAADLDQDGRAEILSASSDRKLRVYEVGANGTLELRGVVDHLVGWHSHHPVAFDLVGDGSLCFLAVGETSAGLVEIRAYRADMSLLWRSAVDAKVADARGVILNAGRFLGANHAGVAVSVTDAQRINEGTHLLDGRTGAVVWHKRLYKNGPIAMPYRPNGIPTACDIDGDGVDEIGMDLLSYMAFLRGSDGSFALIYPTANITDKNSTYAGMLYNTYYPLFKTATDSAPHWFVSAGYGTIGLMKPDPTAGLWRQPLGYDAPTNVGAVDVDGDHALDVGYAPENQNDFFCRDLWSGDVKWTYPLEADPSEEPNPVVAPNMYRAVGHASVVRRSHGAVITADFDGDERGEFFNGSVCLGDGGAGRGRLLWRSPVPLSWPLVADVDGDGAAEIAGTYNGRVVVLKAR